MKRYIALLLTFMMMCSVCIVGNATAKPDLEQRMANQNEANEQYNMLLQGLEQKKNSRSATVDYYGGAYINDDGDLVVCVTDTYATGSYELQNLTGNDDIQIRRVSYTYDEIKQEQARITALYQAYAGVITDEKSGSSAISDSARLIVSSLCGTYIDEEKNTLVVEIQELDEKRIAAFNEAFSDKEYIEFKTGYSFASTSSTETKPGMRIYTSSGSSLSAGYPVYYTAPWGQKILGFITAGHAVSVGDVVYRNANQSQMIGTCIKSQCSGSVDAALIRIDNSSYAPSFTTNSNTLLIGSFTLAQGSYVYKEGTTTGLTYGEILSASYNVDSENLTDLYLTDALILPGDSGGVAYDAGNRVVGSVSGAVYIGTPSASTFQHGGFCKYGNVSEAFYCSITN